MENDCYGTKKHELTLAQAPRIPLPPPRLLESLRGTQSAVFGSGMIAEEFQR